jgi:MarR family transcriptional regulator, organic hydroperoxide resistance regulator
MGGDDRWQVLLDRLATLRQAIVPGVLLGAVHLTNDLDLSLTHLATLYVLQQQEEALTVNRVAETVGLSVSQASRIIDHLVGHDLVSRTEDARDRRAKRVAISPRGRQLLRTFEHDVTQAQFSVIAELPADDQAVIIRAIDLMARAAASAPAAPNRPHTAATPPPPGPADRSPRPPRAHP